MTSNPYTAEISGLDLDALLNTNVFDYFHPEDKQHVINIIADTQQAPGKQHTHRFKKPDGSYLWCKWQVVHAEGCDEFYILGEDVSEQKRISSAFAATEQVTDTGYWEIDLSTKVLFWSDKVHEIHETDRHSFKPKVEDGLKFYPPESVEPLLGALEELETTGKPYNLDLAFISSKGNRLIVNAQGFSEVIDGNVVRSFGTFKDLTKIKEDEATRQSLEQRIILALEAAKIGVWEYHFKDDVLVWDKRLFEIYGKTDDGPLSFKDWQNTVHPDDLEDAQAAFEEAISTHAYFNHTFRIKTSTGGIKHILGMAAASYDNNGVPVSVTGVNIDLSESEQAKIDLENAIKSAQENAELAKTLAEKAKLADVQKSEFLANMSHEIRTPISGIMGLVDIMGEINRQSNRGFARKKEFERYLDLAKKTSNHLLNVIGDILDFSKIEAGKIKIQHEPFELESLLKDLISGYKLQANEKGLYLDFKTQGISSNLVQGDEIRLKQILYNLLSNALKFTDNGGLTIRAKMKQQADGKHIFICSIVDTGCGIDESKLPRLFSPFEQLDSSSAKRAQGTGLGLSISNELAILMGGKITVSSRKEQGSTFTLHLPFDNVDCESQTPSKHVHLKLEEHINPSLKNARILVAEDNEINQIIIGNALTQLGLQFVLVDDGIAALETLNSYPPGHFHSILMDCQMPRLDGYETSRTIRQSPALSQYKKIPIIALTANAMVGDRKKCIDAGMNDYIAKPLDKSLLINKLNSLVS